MRNYLLILFLFISGTTTTLFSQTITINGPSITTAGTQEFYSAQFDYYVNPYANISWVVSGGTIVEQYNNPSNPYCFVVWDTPGIGSISIYEDLNGIWGTLEVQIEQEEETCDQANAGPDKTICLGNSTTIGTPALPGYSYSWFPTTGLNNPNIAQPTFNGNQSATYILTMTKQNLIVNGNFENGNSGFSSDLALYPNSTPGGAGNFIVGTNPQLFYNTWCWMQDHTPNGQNMLIVDAPFQNAPQFRFWYQTINITPNTNYKFEGFFSTASSAGEVNFSIGLLGNISGATTQNYSYQSICENWNHISIPWNSGNNTQITIEMRFLTSGVFGNDLSIDDLYFGICPTTTDQVTVNVVPNTNPTISPSGTYTRCSFWEGESNPVTLTTNLTSNLQWYRGGNLIPGATSPTYTAYADNGQGNIVKTYSYTVRSTTPGCAYESPATTINFVPTPYIYMATSPCRNSPITLYTTDYGAGATYSWSIPGAIISPNANSRQIQITFPGSYSSNSFTATLNVTNSYNCNGSNQQTFSFFTACRNAGNSSLAEIKLFPNPANNSTTISSKESISAIEIISTTDYSTRQVRTNGTNSVTINTSNLRPGLYSCKVVTTSGTEYLKLMIER